VPVLKVEALALLEGQEWPGNVRELEGVLLRAVVGLSRAETIEAGDLEPYLAPRRERLFDPSLLQARSLPDLRRELEREYLVEAFLKARGDPRRLMERLGVKRTRLYTWLRRLGIDETALVDVFRKGGGVDYSAFDRFHDLMAESSRTTLDGTLLTRTLPLVPGLVDRLERGIDVADVGCGQGVAILMMARRFPRSRFVGLDLAADAIAGARAEADRDGVVNARFVVQDAASFGGPPAFDFITAFDAIHDQAAPRRVLRGIREALRPGGVLLMVDIAASSHLERNLDNPLAPFLFTVSTMHCMTVSLAQGGEGLGACWGEEKARELLAEAGFSTVDVSTVEGDPLNAYYVCR
jgi:SAM-dependent methyltransferase